MRLFLLPVLLALTAMGAVSPPTSMTYYGPHKEEALKLYAGLPTRGKDVPFLAWEAYPGGEFDTDIFAEDNLIGRYFRDGDRTFVILGYWKWREDNFIHEYGHFLWYEVLTEEERARFTTFWQQHRKAAMPTEYARTSVHEGWAECFEGLHSKETWSHSGVIRQMLAEMKVAP
jgi:hypothetical protein